MTFGSKNQPPMRPAELRDPSLQTTEDTQSRKGRSTAKANLLQAPTPLHPADHSSNIRRANQEVVQDRTQRSHPKQPSPHYKGHKPTKIRKKFSPHIDSNQRNKHRPPEALQIVPSSKGGTKNNSRNVADENLDSGDGVHQTMTLSTSTAPDFKGCSGSA